MDTNGTHEIVSFVTDDEIHAAGDTTIRCKFVVVKTPETVILAFGPIFRYAYHANILQKLCDQRQILTRWERPPDNLQVVDPHVVVHGGGYLAWNPSSRQAHFGGSSKAYGVFDPDMLQAALTAPSVFVNHNVTVED